MSRAKEAAGRRAAEFVESGMTVGLGTGSTVFFTLVRLAERIEEEGLAVRGVPTSVDTELKAGELGIPLTTLDDVAELDLTIDGADEIDAEFNMIKGGGGALLREKIVAAAANRFIVIADDSKLVDRLGTKMPIPVEIARFGFRGTLDQMRRFGNPTLRTVDREPVYTDNGNFVVDLQVEPIEHPARFNQLLASVAGVLETGLFIGIADEALVGGVGGVKRLQPR